MLSTELTTIFADIPTQSLIMILFEMNRYYDKDLKTHFKNYKNNSGITLDTFQRKTLRLYYYYGDDKFLTTAGIKEFPTVDYKKEDITLIDQLTIEKLSLPTKNKIIKSINSRYKEITTDIDNIQKSEYWLKKYKEKYNNGYDFISYSINQEIIEQENYFDKILQDINYIYKELNNYRYVSIVLEDYVYKDNKDISWQLLFKLAIYMENFIYNKKTFFAFKKEKRISEMLEFLEKNKNLQNVDFNDIVNKFYSGISTGFVFCDLLISDNQMKKILIMRKITLDETPVMCPSCLQEDNRGNSYPLMFLKSWECQNPECAERSKSGRGKRFDEYGVYRYFKLVEKDNNNNINKELYTNWRRDIFLNDLDPFEMLIKYYTWNNEKILLVNKKIENNYGRNVEYIEADKILRQKAIKYQDLPIIELFTSIYKLANNLDVTRKLVENIEIFNEDSTSGICITEKNKICCAITSPPYYNAREYSQWTNFLVYLIDMMLNANSIYNRITKEGTYLYNVGDIVDRDNVYVASNMSNRRIMLGFYSAMVFDIVGFKLVGNKIWDKGEVESKRNSTVNLVSGYVKYVNCYEHVLVFKKVFKQTGSENKVYRIKPVYKINSKGENILGHTAPYPEEIVELISEYMDSKKYLLDPYLGSGTTGVWAKKNNYKFIGFELNKQYYKLSKNRINELDTE